MLNDSGYSGKSGKSGKSRKQKPQQPNQHTIMNMRFNWLYKAGCVSMISLLAMGGIYGHAGKLPIAGQKLFQKAIFYHFANTFGLFAAALVNQSKPTKPFRVAVYGFLAGFALFVGPLYIRAIHGYDNILAKMMPLGGVAIIAAWIGLIFA